MPFCTTCDEYHSFTWGKHDCRPLWEVCDPELDPEYWFKVRAWNEEEAAAKFCKEQDGGNAECAYIRNGGADLIMVRPRGKKTPVVKVSVHAESYPTYTGTVLYVEEESEK